DLYLGTSLRRWRLSARISPRSPYYFENYLELETVLVESTICRYSASGARSAPLDQQTAPNSSIPTLANTAGSLTGSKTGPNNRSLRETTPRTPSAKATSIAQSAAGFTNTTLCIISPTDRLTAKVDGVQQASSYSIIPFDVQRPIPAPLPGPSLAASLR